MADVTLPAPHATDTWLDRPLIPDREWARAFSINWEYLAYVATAAAGFLLRIWDVGSRAMHHDESLHAYYSWQNFVGLGYSYDPLMHGPFQFEVVPLFYLIFGVSEFSARLLAVVLGTVLIFLPFFLRRYLSSPGALFASGLIAISPGLVYFSRFIRDDIYLACFTLALFVCIVRFMDERKPIYLYLGAASAALAMASMEAAYITFFIFGSFIVFELIRERLSNTHAPLTDAIRNTRFDSFLTCLAVFVVLIILLFSTFFTNPMGIWDSQDPICLQNCLSLHPVWSSSRKDILGGIAYWFAQHSVQRGSQPWFYYLLLIPLYEQVAVVFGIAGIVFAVLRRSIFTTFLVWWAVMSLVLYSWAGEKMPWLSIHITLPFIVLAGLVLGKIVNQRKRGMLIPTLAVLVPLLALEIHSTFLLNYVDGANPTEMYVYVQTSQDVPNVVNEISSMSQKLYGNKSMPIGVDTNDVGGWPFTWYLRNFTAVSQTTSFAGPVCGGQYCPVLLMLEPEFDKYSSQLSSRYIVQKYRWNWWFPQDYMVWFPQHWSNLSSDLQGHGSLAGDLFGSSTDRQHVWNWLLYRTPFGDRGARWLYFLVERKLVPHAGEYAVTPPSTGASQPAANVAQRSATLQASLTGSGSALLQGPRGITSGPDGMVYATDPLTQQLWRFDSAGRATIWGSSGTGPGQFAQRDSPQGVAVGPHGNVYVADTWNQRIEVFSRDGKLMRQWQGTPSGTVPGPFYGPRSIAVSQSGRVYVADTGNKRILVYSLTGRYLETWGTPGTGAGQYNEPSAVAVNAAGDVYVADFWNQRIQELSPSGKFVRSWQVPDWVPQSYDEPYLTVSPRTGDVFATDPAQHQVLDFTATGQLRGAFGADKLTLPVGVAALTDGRVAVSDATANRIDIFALGARAPTEVKARGTSRPGGVLSR